ncbi:MAG: maleylpyruvate isomerase family mycothiol-dependent enzyme [Aeromicrobium sp.]
MTSDRRRSVIAEVAAASHDIQRCVRSVSPERLAGDSLLPGWTRGHVVAHICGFSHAIARQWEYALRGELVAQYDGGVEGRNAAIDDQASWTADEQRRATDAALGRLAAVIGAMPAQDWELPISYRDGTAFDGLLAVWRELVVHLTDLDLGQDSSTWSEDFCAHLFEFLAPRVPPTLTIVMGERGGVRVGGGPSQVSATGAMQDLAAWVAGREPVGPIAFSTGQAPELLPWPARKN